MDLTWVILSLSPWLLANSLMVSMMDTVCNLGTAPLHGSLITAELRFGLELDNLVHVFIWSLHEVVTFDNEDIHMSAAC